MQTLWEYIIANTYPLQAPQIETDIDFKVVRLKKNS